MAGYCTPKIKSSHCDVQFKTPYSFRTPKPADYNTPQKDMSDGESSISSSSSGVENVMSSVTGSNENLSIVADFDDYVRLLRLSRGDDLLSGCRNFVEQVKQLHVQWQLAVVECQRLQGLLDIKTHESSDLESKLSIARRLLDQEKRHTRKAEDDKYHLEIKIAKTQELLFKDQRSHLPQETREKLAFLNNNNENQNQVQLSAIPEVNTTGSLLSDFSYSRSEDDLDVSAMHSRKTWKKHRPSGGMPEEPAPKKRRSSTNKVVEISNAEKVRATTTVTVSKDGPITATSVIESIPTDGNDCQFEEVVRNLIGKPLNRDAYSSPRPNLRQHAFQAKTVVMPDTCGPCEKRIRFGKTVLKCKECRVVCHVECKDKVPLSCVPSAHTPVQKNMLGPIADYTPITPPMVPAIVIHCLNEIENRGLNEIGLYRIPGSERDVKCLKEKFMRGKGAPCINQTDVHVLCGTVKDFLRSLQEPLVTRSLWHDFVAAVEAKDAQDVTPALYQIISELPQPNRDTLAYMMLHLKKISVSKECKMPAENLAKVFGPTIVGYSSEEPDKETLFAEVRKQVMVMEYLINLPTDYWGLFLAADQHQSNKLQQTPSTDSLLRPTTTRGFFTPSSMVKNTKGKRRFFNTPPNPR